MLPIIASRKSWYTISGIAFTVSILAMLVWGLHIGIDFTGGTSAELRFSKERPTPAQVQKALEPLNLGAMYVGPAGDTDIIIRSRPIKQDEREKMLAKLQESFGGKDAVLERQFETVGPVIGEELKSKTLWAILMAIIAISLYITWAFRRVSFPVKSWKYGVCTIIALFHDVVIPAGVFAILGHFYGLEVSVLFVTALLTVLGFSVHDTIVVFDRIRENLTLNRGSQFEEVVNKSVNQTLARSINTSLTVMLVLVATIVFGGPTIRDFVFTIAIGILVGTYSSIFIASPLLVTWHEWEMQKARR